MKNSPRAAKGGGAAKKKATVKSSPAKRGRTAKPKPKSAGVIWMRDDEGEEVMRQHFPEAMGFKFRNAGNRRYVDIYDPPWHSVFKNSAAKGRSSAGTKKTLSTSSAGANKPATKGKKGKAPAKKATEEVVNSVDAESEDAAPKSPARRGKAAAKSAKSPPRSPAKSPGRKAKTAATNEEAVNGDEPKTPTKVAARGRRAAKASPPPKPKKAEPKTPEKSPRKRKAEAELPDDTEEAGKASPKKRKVDAKVVNGEETKPGGRKPKGRPAAAAKTAKSKKVAAAKKSPAKKKPAAKAAKAQAKSKSPKKSRAARK